MVVGSDESSLSKGVDAIVKKLRLKIFQFPLAKIEDARSLKDFTKLKVDTSTAILINSIEEATPEAQNAFLKNLEEPQENLYYILTTQSVRQVLPTIVSRCLVIKTPKLQNSKPQNTEETKKFLKMTVGEKLAYVDKIKEREQAVKFIEEFILGCHQMLHETKDKHLLIAKYLDSGTKTLKNLKANGNVTLQLANFVIGLVS